MNRLNLNFCRNEGLGGITTLAVLTVDCRDDIQTPDQAMSALESAVTDWVIHTREGADEYSGSCEDFNIGDLSSCQSDPKLVGYLIEHGLKIVSLEVADAESSFSYDRLLVDSSEVADARAGALEHG